MKKIHIDVEFLNKLYACDEGIADFEACYPEGLTLTNDQEVNLAILMGAPDGVFEGYPVRPVDGPALPRLLGDISRFGWLWRMLADHGDNSFAYEEFNRTICNFFPSQPGVDFWAAWFAYAVDVTTY